MPLQNQWVTYLNRSYLQIKNSVLTRLGTLNPEITDHSESNILVIIISIFSGIAEMLNYYIDNMAREAFITTARRFSSVVKHTRLIDYRIKAMIPASVDINIAFVDNNNDALPIDSAFTIPSGTIFSTDNAIKFISIADYNVIIGDTIIIIPVEQKEFQSASVIGTTDGSPDQILSLGLDYVHNSSYVTIGGVPWERVETLGRSEPEDLHYIVEIAADKVAYIRFGDGLNGKIPIAAQQVLSDLYTSLGDVGNVNADTINSTEFDFTTTGATIVNTIITNPKAAISGSPYETIERIRRSAPLSLRTLDRAVTRQDYIDIAKLAPGVDKATLFYECGKFIDIYISPNDGGIAQTGLLTSTKNYIDERKMVTTFVSVLPAGEGYIYIDINATAKFRRDGVIVKQDIIDALIDEYSYKNSDVNRPIRKSDIIALIDNLEKVDFLTIAEMYLIPYMRPKNHTTDLLNTISIRTGSVLTVKWRLQYDGTRMRLFKNNDPIGNIDIGIDYIDIDNIFKINIQASSYTIGEEWEFKTYAWNENIELDDFSVPVTRLSDLSITVIEQLATNS